MVPLILMTCVFLFTLSPRIPLTLDFSAKVKGQHLGRGYSFYSPLIHLFSTRRLTIMAGKGKRPREQSCKGGSGATPPEKRTSRVIRKRKNTIQTSLSEWVTDDDATHSQPTRMFTPPLSQIPISQPDMLSPYCPNP